LEKENIKLPETNYFIKRVIQEFFADYILIDKSKSYSNENYRVSWKIT